MKKIIVFVVLSFIFLYLCYYFRVEIRESYLLSGILVFGSMFGFIGYLFWIVIKAQKEIDDL